jgi:hypothetical protein
MTVYNTPFLRPEQRVERLFELNALHYIEQNLLLTLTQEQTDVSLAANALMTIRQWADKEYAKIEQKYRALAVENMVRREVTSWLK